jgi:hypothetical protein
MLKSSTYWKIKPQEKSGLKRLEQAARSQRGQHARYALTRTIRHSPAWGRAMDRAHSASRAVQNFRQGTRRAPRFR